MPVTAWEVETALVENAHDLGDGAELQERLEDKPQPLLDREVGIFDDHPAWIAHEADRQGEHKLAAFGLRQKPARQAAADRVQLEFRDRPLEAEKQATVGAAGIVDAVAIGN